MTGCGGVSCFCDSACCECACEACAPAEPAPSPSDFPSPVPTLPLAALPVGRPNPCGGRWWTGQAWAFCMAQAPQGFARCLKCQASERERAKAVAAKRASEQPKRRDRR